MPNVVLILQPNTCAEELKRRKFEMLLRATEELGHPFREVFVEKKVLAAVVVLANEKAKRLDQMGVQRNFVHREIVH